LYRGVRDPELLGGHGVFLAEGRLVVQRLLEQSVFRARSVLVTPAAHASLEAALATASCPVYLADQQLLTALAGFNVHRGCLALGERGAPRRVSDLAHGTGPLVILERVGNPDNIGGTFRNAAAFGASGVVLSPGCADPLYRKAIRTSMGAALAVPFAVAEDWPGTLGSIRDAGWTIVALTLGEGAGELRSTIARLRESRLALLLGHEGHGLTAEAEAMSDVRARIAIGARADSLNVATAAAIALYEAGSPFRQTRAYPEGSRHE
jgi:tRNA G18 (ribose-2'-O)-methylase SpoU